MLMNDSKAKEDEYKHFSNQDSPAIVSLFSVSEIENGVNNNIEAISVFTFASLIAISYLVK